jgi:hypothetical protein
MRWSFQDNFEPFVCIEQESVKNTNLFAVPAYKGKDSTCHRRKEKLVNERKVVLY